MVQRRALLTCALAPLGLAHLGLAHAQAYPSKGVVKLLVGFPAGQSTDLVARLVADELQKSMNQSFIVDNRPGAGATVAVAATAKAAPDGYTLLVSSSGPLSVAPSLYSKLPYDTLRDLVPVSFIVKATQLILTHNQSPSRTLPELLERAKQPGSSITYASSGNGTANHLTMEMLRGAARVPMIHVPYRGSTPAMADLLGGSVDVMAETATVALPQVKSGRLRVLATTSLTRLPELPDVPTVAELGFPGFEGGTWIAMMAPRGTPQPVVSQLHTAMTAILTEPRVKNALLAMGAVPLTAPLLEVEAYIKTETIKWAKVVKESGITMD